MIGSIISAGVGAGLNVAGTIFGGIKASEALKKTQANIKQQKESNEAWYNRRYNENATERADAQRILAKTEESIKNRNKQAAASAAVMGGTEESVAASKAANSQALAEAASQIAVNADSRKDQIESTYQQRDNAYDNQLNAIEQQKAAQMGQAAQGLASAGANLVKAF